MLGKCTHQDTNTQSTARAQSQVTHQYIAEYAMAWKSDEIHDPVQHLISKKGSGLILEGVLLKITVNSLTQYCQSDQNLIWQPHSP